MPDFRTVLHWPESRNQITLSDPILTMGSCFAEVLGNHLKEYKFNALTIPFGITYNPWSIHQQLLFAIKNESLAENTFIENQGVNFNYFFHSDLSALSKDRLRQMIREKQEQTHLFLKEARWLILTYGTAWIYRLNTTGETVTNCHKMPAHLFRKELLDDKIIQESFDIFYDALKRINPGINIILTVSPVRHIKDTLPLNSVSKSLLRVACHHLQQAYPSVEYFPSYEIMMDDLRDYRFYKRDMIHPNEEAEAYILELFSKSYIDQQTRAFMNEWSEIRKALQHKPFHPQGVQHQQFLKNTLSRMEKLQSVADVSEEIRLLKQQLTEAI